jgi:hypothetical protein
MQQTCHARAAPSVRSSPRKNWAVIASDRTATAILVELDYRNWCAQAARRGL